MIEDAASGRPSGFGAIILAGGASRRMGADKAALDWRGARAVDILATLAADLGLQSLIVSGRDYGLPFVPDPHPDAGPVAGLLAAVGPLRERGCNAALVLAVDAPSVLAEDLTLLMAAPAPGAIYSGLPLPMAVAFDAVPPAIDGGAPLRRLVELAGLAVLPCPDHAWTRLRGANTPEEWTALLAQGQAPRSRPPPAPQDRSS